MHECGAGAVVGGPVRPGQLQRRLGHVLAVPHADELAHRGLRARVVPAALLNDAGIVGAAMATTARTGS